MPSPPGVIEDDDDEVEAVIANLIMNQEAEAIEEIELELDLDSEKDEDRLVIPSLVENDDEVAKLSEVAATLKLWEERVQAATNGPYNPVSILTRLSEIIEYESLEYLKLDPDPFDDRHPSRTHPSCSLGTSLKALFKKEVFMTKLVHEYLKEHWGEEWDLAVNTTACRLFVNILPGLETSVVYQETEGLIQRLFVWAETAPEPLKSYSLGLLGASMEIPEIAGKFKEKNIHLVQLMLRRLRDLQNEFFSSQHKSLTHRSFSQFSTPNGGGLRSIAESPMEEIPVRSSVPNGTFDTSLTVTEPIPKLFNGHDMVDSVPIFSTPPPSQTAVKHYRPVSLSLNDSKDELATMNGITPTPSTPKTPSAGLNMITSTPVSTPKSSKKSRSSLTSGNKHFLEPSIQNRTKRRKTMTDPDLDDCSTSSSWAELEPNIIGQWQVFPVNLVTRQIFTLRYLAPLGEYQEMLGYAFEHNAIQIIMRYLSKSNQTKETSRLTFEALKYLGALLCHKKFALEFLQAGGLQRLLQVPRPSLSATGVSLCLYYIAYSEDAMEKVCLMSKTALSNLITYVLWLLECSHNSGRNHAIMFFGVIYPFKIMLDLFDGQDGLRAILNVITTQPTFVQMRKNIEGRRMPPAESVNEGVDGMEEDQDLSEEEQMISRQAVRQVSFNLKRYFECHLGFTADKLKRTIGQSKSHPNNITGPVIPPYKALKPFTALDLSSLHSNVSSLLPENAQRWAPVDRFLNQTGLEMIMQTIAMAYEWNYSGRGETVRNMLDVLSICSLVPRTQVLLTDRFKINGASEHSGLSIVLSAAEGEVVNEPDVKKSALQVIGNCVCGPMHHKKPSETQTKVWECTRVNNGILILTRLLQTKSPITDADSIRAMACWCLSGLARYRHVRQVLQQLPLIRSGLIQNLMTEPILQDKRHDHAMFQKYAMEIIKLVHGKEETFNFELGDLIRKSDLISQSKIDYYESDLTELIHDHLIKAGLTETAAVLQMESRSKQGSEISNTSSTAPISLDKIVRQYLVNQHGLCKSPMVICPTFELLKPHKCPSKSDRPKVIDNKAMGSNFCSRSFKREMFGGGGYSRGHEDRKLIYSRYKPFRVLRSADVMAEEDMSFTTCAFSSCYQWTIVGTSTGDVKLFNNTNSQEDGTYPCHDSEIYHVQPNNKGSLLLTSNIWRRPLSALWRMEGLFDKVMDFERDEYVEFSKLNQDKVITTNGETTTIYDIETKMKLMTLRPKMSNQYLKNRATFDPYDDLILSDGVLWDFKSGKEVHKFDKLNENLSGVFNPKNGIEIIANTEIWDVRTFHLLKTVRQLDQCLLTFTNDASVIYGVKIEREEHPSGDGTVAFRHADTSFVVIDNLDDYSSIATIELKRHIMSLATSPNDLQLALIENHTTMEETLSTPDSCVRFYEVGRTRVNELSNTDGVDDEDDVQSDDDADVDDDDDDDDEDDGDESGSDDDDEEEIAADNDLDRLLDELLPPGDDVFMNNLENEDQDDSDSSSWEDEDDADSDDSSDNDSDSE